MKMAGFTRFFHPAFWDIASQVPKSRGRVAGPTSDVFTRALLSNILHRHDSNIMCILIINVYTYVYIYIDNRVCIYIYTSTYHYISSDIITYHHIICIYIYIQSICLFLFATGRCADPRGNPGGQGGHCGNHSETSISMWVCLTIRYIRYLFPSTGWS